VNAQTYRYPFHRGAQPPRLPQYYLDGFIHRHQAICRMPGTVRDALGICVAM
jgi:hypothetical protein